MQKLSEVRCFGGRQQRYSHNSKVLNCDMQVSIFLPPQAEHAPVPVLYWLSGLTCTDENFVIKAGAQRIAAELGIAIVCPDTSPRGEDVADDAQGAYDFGLGAGFYVNATQAPFARHYQMYDYVTQELPQWCEGLINFSGKRAVCGHSMGGHGALITALREQGKYTSVSAFAPIVNPTQCPWGQKAFTGYLGDNESAWREYDAVDLIRRGHKPPPVLIDQGEADNFLAEQLLTQNLQAACAEQGVSAQIHYRAGYDHSYFFIASFIESHLRFHHQYLLS